MNRFYRFTAAASMFAAIAIAPLASHAEYKCDEPHGMIDKRACGQAAAGPETLRRFVERTRTIYGLYYWDYTRRDQLSATVAGMPSEPLPAAAKGQIVAVERKS